ncbi:MAG: MFS transporter [Gammaproteobacteria bacterium]|nr:MFS transporter [Gammaproteobacteria bacterium]
MEHPTPLSVQDAATTDRGRVRGALASLALSMLLSSLGTSIAPVALPSLAQAFGASFAAVQWVILAYLLAITSLIVSVGRLGDLLGRRRLLLAGLILFTLASLLCALAPSLGLLIAARAVQGLGAAILMALSLALVGEAVPKERAGRAMGLLGTLSAVGTALGPSLGGMLLAGLGWQAVFLVNLPLGILALGLARHYLPADAPNAGRPGFDALGTLLLILTLLAYALAMSTGSGAAGPVKPGLILAALLGLGLFLFVEARAATPLLHLAMFREPALRGGLAMNLLVSAVMMATLVVGPFYLSRTLGLDAVQLGFAVSVGPLVAALCGLPAGRLVDHFGTTRPSLVGLAGITAGCALLSLLPETLGLAGYLAPLALVTAGYALFQTANNTAVMSKIRQEQRGLVSGMLNLARNLGFITGASALGAIFALPSATSPMATAPAEAVASGMRLSFAAAALLGLAALAIALAGGARPVRAALPGDA